MYSSHTFQTTKATFLIPIHSFYKRRWMHIMFSTCLGLWDVVWKIYFTKNFLSEFKVWYLYILFLVILQSKFSVGFHLELIKVRWTCFLYEFKSSNLLLFFFFLTSDMDIIFLNGLGFKKVLGQEKKLRSNFFKKKHLWTCIKHCKTISRGLSWYPQARYIHMGKGMKAC
jgi:hypothetical protein